MGLHLILVGCLILSSSSCLCLSSQTEEALLHHHVVKVQSLLPSRICSTPKVSSDDHSSSSNHSGGRLSVRHRHGPCSHNSNPPPSLSDLLLQDQSRAASLRLRVNPPSSLSSSSIPLRSGRSLGTGNYVATLSLGTPTRPLTAIVDTGSDLTWVQCQPCLSKCHVQRDPIFDPSLSSTFSNVTCPSPSCSSLLSATGNSPTCASSNCLYSVKYGDDSFSVGILARDNLSLPPSSDTVSSFLFGCGQSQEGLFGQTAGLLGLGRHPLSLVSQYAAMYNRVFSYCLPTSASTGHLTFGIRASAAVAFTPMLTDSSAPSLYFIDLIGFRVGGRLLPVSPVVFRMAGTLIDSGTVITRLPPAAYAALKAAFWQGMGKYPKAAAFSILDTCFDLSGYDEVSVPKVEMVFRGGVAVQVAAQGLLVGPSEGQLCLAFAANTDAGDVGIIGNMQQMTLEVVYDVGNGRIGFGAGGCS